jgi:hypothetical protein
LRSSPKALDSAGAEQSAGPEPPSQSKRPFEKNPFPDIGTRFKKTIHDTLVQGLSRVDSDKRPWFGKEAGPDLLAVSPQAITVAEIIDPRGIEKAVVHSSLDPLASWLLTTPDGAVHPLPNPVPRTLQAIRGVRLKFTPHLERKTDEFHIRVKGLVVFPDDYDVSRVKRQVDYDTATTVMRVINARELPEEIRKPVQPRRINAQRCREWLYATILKGGENGSVAGTWLDPHGAESSKRSRAIAGQASAAQSRMIPEPSACAPTPAPRTKRIVAGMAGLSLVVALPVLIALWQLDRLRFLIAFAESPAREDPPVQSVPLEPSQPSETTERDDRPEQPSHAVDERPPADVERDAVQNHGIGVAEADGNGEDQPPSTEVQRKAIEDRIDTAIRNRAVGGVKVSFIDDTAYLAGEVISHNQKAAAERAARAIPEVKRVRSSISVMWNRH